MLWGRRLLIAALFVALLVGGWHFAALNSGSVTVNHPAGPIGEFRLWAALTGAFAAGVLITGAIAVYRGARLRLVTRRYRKLVDGLQAEVHQLRNLPLTPEEPAEPEANTLSERGS